MNGGRKLQGCKSASWPLVLAGAVIALLTLPRALGLRFNATRSMPRGLYVDVAGAARVGDLVAACVPESAARLAIERGYLGGGPCPGGVEPVAKRVAAVGPATVELTDDGVVVDGELLRGSAIRSHDSAGRPLQPFATGVAPLRDGELWLHSDRDPRSWDSRYFGPVDREAVLSIVRPLLTE